ncbi:GntR family transcriptional regulator [Actinomadura sp. LD22]|uniref:GntR family transcriptional regulator n=1 Tax=Actinomadura physcomitrii TaxID=2650748 RepID=A0A6I4M9G3_9ACTN|nr:winged helix-turn-helix domain-containing protein [Actinomadura physcomitrii]MWA02838.1 GntR family transcriptional regulator [Actinomadura physcomitrii]
MASLDGIAPLRDQLVEVIRERIASGKYQPGTKLPTTSELADEYDISTRTVSEAFRILRESGEVIGVRGRGVFVRPSE